MSPNVRAGLNGAVLQARVELGSTGQPYNTNVGARLDGGEAVSSSPGRQSDDPGRGKVVGLLVLSLRARAQQALR